MKLFNWTKPHLSNWIAQESARGLKPWGLAQNILQSYHLPSDGRPNGLHLVFQTDLSYYNTGGNQRVNTH
jgi:hypothetical protein